MTIRATTVRQSGDVAQATQEGSLIMGGSSSHANRKALGVSVKNAPPLLTHGNQPPSSIRHSSLMDASRNLLGSSMALNNSPPGDIITSATSTTINEMSLPSSSAPTPIPRIPLRTSNAQKPAMTIVVSKASNTRNARTPSDVVDGPSRRLNHHRSVSALTSFPRKAETFMRTARSSASPATVNTALPIEKKDNTKQKPAPNRNSMTPNVTVNPIQTRLPRPSSMLALKPTPRADSPVNGVACSSTTSVNSVSRSTQRHSFMSRLTSSVGHGSSSRKPPVEISIRASKIPPFNMIDDLEEMLDQITVSEEEKVDPVARQTAFEKLIGNRTATSSNSTSEIRPASRTETERKRKDALPMLGMKSRQHPVAVKPPTSVRVPASPARKTVLERAKATTQRKAPIAHGNTTGNSSQSSLGLSQRPPISPRDGVSVSFPLLSEASTNSPSQHLSPLMTTPRGRKVSNQSDIDFKLEQSMAQLHESPLGSFSPKGPLLRSSIGRSSLSGRNTNRLGLSELPSSSPTDGSRLLAQNSPSPKLAVRVAKTSDGTPSRRPSALGSSTADRSAAIPLVNRRTPDRSARPSTATTARLSQLEAEASKEKQESSALIEKVISLSMQSREAAQQLEWLEVERDALRNQVTQMEQDQLEQVCYTKHTLRRRQIKKSREEVAKMWDGVVTACQVELMRAESEATAMKQMMANFEGSVTMAEAAV